MAGNWKMYKTPAETHAFFEAFKPMIAGVDHCEIVICPPFPNLPVAVEKARGSNIAIGGQNLHWGREGAVTGEVSGHMLQAVGCRFVVIAHSERRQYFGETEPDVVRKTQAAIEFGLGPIVCLGERLDEREGNRTEEVLGEQFDGGLAPLTPEQFATSGDRVRTGLGHWNGQDRDPGHCRRRAPFSAREGGCPIWGRACRRGKDPLRRQRQAGQCEEIDGGRRDRRRARGRSEPRPGLLRGCR